ncbi:MAG: hypothetical protein KC766_00460 [Myxococcales bacterium]|nr:hypothetical protein [Myxococcales bacterium]
MSRVEWLRNQIDAAERDATHAASGRIDDAWNSVRQSYGLTSSPLDAGTPIPASELSEVLLALRRRAEQQLSSLTSVEQHGADAAALRSRLQSLGSTSAPAPGVGGLLGGIFANAAAGKNWESSEGGSCQLTLRCPHCGAYQERALNFLCGYCHGSIAGGDE